MFCVEYCFILNHVSVLLFGGGGGLVTKLCLTLASPWTVAHQTPLSMGFLSKNTGVSCHYFFQHYHKSPIKNYF